MVLPSDTIYYTDDVWIDAATQCGKFSLANASAYGFALEKKWILFGLQNEGCTTQWGALLSYDPDEGVNGREILKTPCDNSSGELKLVLGCCE